MSTFLSATHAFAMEPRDDDTNNSNVRRSAAAVEKVDREPTTGEKVGVVLGLLAAGYCAYKFFSGDQQTTDHDIKYALRDAAWELDPLAGVMVAAMPARDVAQAVKIGGVVAAGGVVFLGTSVIVDAITGERTLAPLNSTKVSVVNNNNTHQSDYQEPSDEEIQKAIDKHIDANL